MIKNERRKEIAKQNETDTFLGSEDAINYQFKPIYNRKLHFNKRKNGGN